MPKGQEDATLARISLAVRMELARIIDPRHDRDPDIVLTEIRQICEVMVRAFEDVAKISLDTNAAAMSYSATAAPEDTQDAEHPHAQTDRDSTATNPRKAKRPRPQVPLP